MASSLSLNKQLAALIKEHAEADDLIVLKNGSVLATWIDLASEGEGRLLGQIFNSTGKPKGHSFTVADRVEPGSVKLFQLENGRPVALWTAGAAHGDLSVFNVRVSRSSGPTDPSCLANTAGLSG